MPFYSSLNDRYLFFSVRWNTSGSDLWFHGKEITGFGLKSGGGDGSPRWIQPWVHTHASSSNSIWQTVRVLSSFLQLLFLHFDPPSFSGSPNDQVINAALLATTGFFIGGPSNMISSAISADLGRQEALRGSQEALATVTGIVDGTGSIGAAGGQVNKDATWKLIMLYIKQWSNNLYFLHPLVSGVPDWEQAGLDVCVLLLRGHGKIISWNDRDINIPSYFKVLTQYINVWSKIKFNSPADILTFYLFPLFVFLNWSNITNEQKINSYWCVCFADRGQHSLHHSTDPQGGTRHVERPTSAATPAVKASTSAWCKAFSYHWQHSRVLRNRSEGELKEGRGRGSHSGEGALVFQEPLNIHVHRLRVRKQNWRLIHTLEA